MATFDKRTSPRTGKTSWRARIRRKGLPALIKTFPRKTDAKLWAQETEASLSSGQYLSLIKAKNHQVNDVLDNYESEIVGRLKDPYSRLYQLKAWRAELGDMTLADLQPHHIRKFRETVKGRTSNSTANRYVAAFSAALSFAVKELGWIEKNPALRIRKLTEPKGRTRFLSQEERDQLIEACVSCSNYPEIYAIVLIAITTGMRRGEILNLRWADCDFQSRRLIVRDSKNGTSRSVPLVGPALTSLINWGKVRPLDNDTLVFPSRTQGASNRPLDIDHAWQRVRKAAGLKNFRFHDLRHTTASYLAMNGAGLIDIGDLLGHKSLSMTLRYSHLTQDHKHDTVSRMIDSVFGGKS